MSWFLVALKKYAVSSGRARRKEYWYFALFYVAICVLLGIVSGDRRDDTVAGVLALAMCLPSLAVTVRRLHDTDRSGWWILIGFIPAIGGLVLLVFALLPSNPGHNQYGSNPIEA